LGISWLNNGISELYVLKENNMKTRIMVCLAVVMSLFVLGLLPAAAQEDTRSYC
jgi:hypothetical protein